jgi:hypothetical protein
MRLARAATSKNVQRFGEIRLVSGMLRRAGREPGNELFPDAALMQKCFTLQRTGKSAAVTRES